VEHPAGKKSHTGAEGDRLSIEVTDTRCNKEDIELPQLNLAGIIIARPSTFVKVLKILQKLLYEENNMKKYWWVALAIGLLMIIVPLTLLLLPSNQQGEIPDRYRNMVLNMRIR